MHVNVPVCVYVGVHVYMMGACGRDECAGFDGVYVSVYGCDLFDV